MVERAVLQNYSPKWARECLSLMRRYAYILESGDASCLWGLSDGRRVKVMKALSMLARITGLRERWRSIREAYGLKWSCGEGNASFLFSSNSYSGMLDDARRLLGMLSDIKPLLVFTALSGLRVSEALEATRLFHVDRDNYLNMEYRVLEHFKYPGIFLRRTKKAFITVLDDFMVEMLEESRPLTYNALRLRIRRRNSNRCNMHMLRKLWATYMRLQGIESEVIDLLQGRTPRSIFHKHYYRPDIASLLENVRKRLEGLRTELGAS